MTNGALLRSRLGLHGSARALPPAAAPLNCALLDITGAASNQHQAKHSVREGDWEKPHSQGPSSSDAAPLLPVSAIHVSSFGKVEDEGPTWDLLGDLAATQHQQCQPQQHQQLQQHQAHEQQAPIALDQQPAASGVVAAVRFGRPEAEQHSCSGTPGAPAQPHSEEADAPMTDWQQPHATSIGRGRTDGSGSSGQRPGTLPTTRRKRLRSIFAEEEQQQQAPAEGRSLVAGAAGSSVTPAGALEGNTAAYDADLYAPLSSGGKGNGKGKPPPGAQPEQQAAGVTARVALAKAHGNPFARTGAAAKGSRITLAANTPALPPPTAAAAEAAGAVARFAGLPWSGGGAAAGKPGQQQQHIQPQQQQQQQPRRNPFKPQQLDPVQQQRLARAEAALASSSSDDEDELQLGCGGTFHPPTGCHPPTSQQEQQAQQKVLQGRQQQLQQHSRLQVRPQAKAGAGTVLQQRQEAEVVDLIGGDVVKAEPLLQPANQEHHQAPPPQIGGQQCAAQYSAAGQHQQAAWEADPGWSAQRKGAEAALAGPAQPFWQAAGDDWQEPQQRQQQSHEPWQQGGQQQQWQPPDQQQQQQQQHWQAQEHQQQHQQQQPQLFWQAPDYEELEEVGEPGCAAGADAGGNHGGEPQAQHWAGDQQGAAGGSAEWQQAQHAGGGLADQAGGAGGGAGGDAPWWTRFPDFVPVAALHGGTDPRDGAPVYVNYRQQFTGITSGGATTASRAVAGRGPFEAVGGGHTGGGKRQRNGGGGGQGGGRGSSGQGGAGSGGGGKTGYWQAEGGKNVYIDARGQKLWGQMAYRTAKKEQGEPLTAKGGGGRKRKAASAAGTPRRKGKKSGKAARGGKRGKK